MMSEIVPAAAGLASKVGVSGAVMPARVKVTDWISGETGYCVVAVGVARQQAGRTRGSGTAAE